MADQVTLAAVAGAHGVGGEVRLKLFAEGVDSLKRQKTLYAGARPLTLKGVRPGSAGAIAGFAEIADRAGAEALRGTLLTVPRDALPPLEEGEYYYADLIGLPCATISGRPLGIVAAVENFGAGDIIEIERPNGARFMVPVKPAVEIEPDRLIVDDAFAD
ncbi:MAG TPA: ribosome maturation factor RimM [Allosphingosinicella sp.]|nr:ribosome maturation factor RimM [Allosphingosinicella sp.]